jgi:aromatic-L-amino-acid decarboxylase
MTPPKNPSRALEPDARELRRLIDACAEFVVQQIDSLPRQPSWDTEGAAEVAAGFREAAPEQGSDLADILGRLGPAIAKSFNTAGPGYLAYIPGGGLPSAAIADFIACAVNRFVGVAAAAPVLARIEATSVEWLAAAMGYPASAGGVLTSGGSISNLTALITARLAKLPEDFLRGTIYMSEQTHHSVARAARLAGFPESAVRMVPVDARLRLRAADLEAMIDADRRGGRQPFLLIANVGTTNTGAIDPLPDMLQVARRHDLWVHADAAYGGFFRLAPGGERLMPGIEACDSITIDPHKGLFLPYGTGCLLVRDPALLKAAHRGAADYFQDLREGQVAPDFHSLSPELSRDFRGLRVWLPIVLHGLAAFREQIGEKLDLARGAWEALRAAPFLAMIDEPQLSIVAFTGAPRRGDGNAFAAELLRRVNARRRVFLSSTTLGGRFVVRICVLSFRTHAETMRLAVEAILEEGRALDA